MVIFETVSYRPIDHNPPSLSGASARVPPYSTRWWWIQGESDRPPRRAWVHDGPMRTAGGRVSSQGDACQREVEARGALPRTLLRAQEHGRGSRS